MSQECYVDIMIVHQIRVVISRYAVDMSHVAASYSDAYGAAAMSASLLHTPAIEHMRTGARASGDDSTAAC